MTRQTTKVNKLEGERACCPFGTRESYSWVASVASRFLLATCLLPVDVMIILMMVMAWLCRSMCVSTLPSRQQRVTQTTFNFCTVIKSAPKSPKTF